MRFSTKPRTRRKKPKRKCKYTYPSGPKKGRCIPPKVLKRMLKAYKKAGGLRGLDGYVCGCD